MGVFSAAIRRLFMAGASPDDIVAAVEEMEQSCLRFSIPRQPGERAAPKREDYPADFEEFWKQYPETEGTSKKEAFKRWGEIPKEQRELALQRLPAWIELVAKRKAQNKDYRPVHACRYLSQERYATVSDPSPNASAASPRVFISRDDERFSALSERLRKQTGKPTPLSEGGWYFERSWLQP